MDDDQVPVSPSLRQWQADGASFSYRDQPVFYRAEGNGPALLCVHGFPTASWDWHRVWPELVSRFRVVAPDLVGFGFSAKPVDYAYSIMDQADMVEALLADLGIDTAHVLAHDYGDTVAQELLARAIRRKGDGENGLEILSACLLNGGLFPETHRRRPIQQLLLTPLGPLLSRLYNRKSFARSFKPIFGAATRPDEGELDDFWALLNANRGIKIIHKLIRYMPERERHRERWVGVLGNSSIPLRLVIGADDPVSGAHMADRYRELVPDPDVVVLEGIGHYPQVEDPDGVLRAFLEFLG